MTFPCQICHKEFTSKSYMKAHIKGIHEAFSRFECPHCPKSFSWEKTLDVHIAKVHTSGKHTGPNGGQSKSEKQQSERNPHDDPKTYRCIHCSKVFKSRFNLKEHMITHKPCDVAEEALEHEAEGHKCDICSKVYSQKKTLEVHIRDIHHGRDGTRCPICSKVLSSKGNLKVHLMNLHLACFDCWNIFSSPEQLHNHLKEDHQGLNECGLCGQHFTKAGLKRHNLKGHDQEESADDVEVITEDAQEDLEIDSEDDTEEVSDTPNDVIDQEEEYSPSANRTTPSPQCPICSKTFVNPYYIHGHMDVVHGGDRKFRCELCSKAFGQNAHLQRHISVVHEKLRLFECRECSKAYGQKYGLQYHMRTAHNPTAKKPKKKLKCTSCNMCFTNEPEILEHTLKTHVQRISV